MRLNRFWLALFLVVIILVITVGAAFFLLKRSKPEQTTQVVSQQQSESKLPPLETVVTREENTFHLISRLGETDPGNERVQLRGVVKTWKEKQLIVGMKDGDATVLFGDQVQFAKNPYTYTYPRGGNITANKVYINYLTQDHMGTPSALSVTQKKVSTGDEVLILALERSQNSFDGYVLVLFEDSK